MTTRNAIFTSAIAATIALAGCEGVQSPVEPTGAGTTGSGPGATGATSNYDLTGGLGVISETLAGAQDLALTFSSTVPLGSEATAGDSLAVVVTDLLGGASLSLAPSYSVSGDGSNSGTIVDGEPISVSGVAKVRTSKVTYSDGTSAWDQEIATENFLIRGRSSGGECKEQDAMRTREKTSPGAQVFQTRARQAVVCPGDGRVFYTHLVIQTTITPSGQVNSQVKETCVSKDPDLPACP
jgi:hypothetical protein